MKLTHNEQDTITKNRGIQPRRRYTPSGRIRVYDNGRKEGGGEIGYVGLQGVYVRVRRWFTYRRAHTDANGYFRADGSFKRPGNYALFFETNQFDVRKRELGQAWIDGPKQRGPWNYDIGNGHVNQFYAQVFRAAYDYYNQWQPLGLGIPLGPQRAKLKIAAKNWPHPSNKYLGLHRRGWRIGGLLSSIVIHNGPFVYPLCEETYLTTIHELGHSAHWWANPSVFRSLRGDYFGGALAESWAEGVGWFFSHRKYPMLTKYLQNHSRRQPRVTLGYTPLVIDLMDHYNQRERTFNNLDFPLDKVVGFTISDVWRTLLGSRSLQEWRDKLKELNKVPAKDVDTLFYFYIHDIGEILAMFDTEEDDS